ncbi:hypothetical protein LI221_08275 [Faecalimonas umbilicata]|nr:hypothetical protein [Faecalimonas umbilicata]
MPRCTEGGVRLVFDCLEKHIGTYEFISMFEYILTDRGSEFGDPDALETGVNGIQRSSIYYCDPNAERPERRVGTGTYHAADGLSQRNQF